MKKALINLWYRDTKETPLHVNETAVRIRAGMLLLIPLFLGLTLYDVVYTSNYIVDTNTLVDTYETNIDEHIIYTAEVTHRVYEYSLQTALIFYVLFELLSGMTVLTSRLSPSILISSYFAKQHPPVWKPLAPKRFAWTIGAIVATICLIFFNPDTFAGWLNTITGKELLTTTENFMPEGTGTTLVWVCLSFMWLETVFGFCVGCKVHALLVKVNIIKEECEACNNIDWGKIAKNKS
ncbi:MAG TPA: DUF4395 domain-containing protein [Leucothrix sp.]|nr:DUF4395 domain-containing protein [Leucothrix sp.]